VLLEGVPGIGKTLVSETVSHAIDADFSRIQFTPDLLPSDITGSQIYRPDSGEFQIKKGPVFTNFLLADEINRAPAKVQSALLEVMQERKVTIADKTFSLEFPFLVLATQNPIEQEGTYPLPEAQLDRFLCKILVEYPSREEEIAICKKITGAAAEPVKKVLSKKELKAMIDAIAQEVFVDEKIYEYVEDLVRATRNPESVGLSIGKYLNFGVSPRAAIGMIVSSKAKAFLSGRGYVTPEDIKAVAPSVLRHRFSLSFEAL